jgi:hypothetical protein
MQGDRGQKAERFQGNSAKFGRSAALHDPVRWRATAPEGFDAGIKRIAD